jgi:hypothetical protein
MQGGGPSEPRPDDVRTHNAHVRQTLHEANFGEALHEAIFGEANEEANDGEADEEANILICRAHQ